MDQYVAAYWKVKSGNEDEFIERWKEFTGWTTANVPGAKSFTLLRNTEDPQYFISFGTWADRDAIQSWFDMPGFMGRYMSARELCDEQVGAVHTVEAHLSPVS